MTEITFQRNDREPDRDWNWTGQNIPLLLSALKTPSTASVLAFLCSSLHILLLLHESHLPKNIKGALSDKSRLTIWDMTASLLSQAIIFPSSAHRGIPEKKKLWDSVSNSVGPSISHHVISAAPKLAFFFLLFFYFRCSLGHVLFPFISSTFFSHVKMVPSLFCPLTPLPFPSLSPRHQPQSQKKQLLSVCPDYSVNQNSTHHVTEQHRLHCMLRTVALHGKPAPAGPNFFSHYPSACSVPCSPFQNRFPFLGFLSCDVVDSSPNIYVL